MTTLPDESSEVRPVAEPVDGAVAERPTLRSAGLRRLLAGMTLVNFLLCVLWAAVGVILVALQVQKVLPSSSDAAKDLGLINITATLPQTVAAAGAGLIITLFHGYTALFPIAAVLGLLGGLLLLPLRSVR